MTDELADTNGHWFLPERLAPILDNVNTFMEMPFCDIDKSLKGMAAQQDWLWTDATDIEKRDPSNFHFWCVTRGIFSAPKSYACQYTNNKGSLAKEKIKFKGIPSRALINGNQLDFKLVNEAYA